MGHEIIDLRFPVTKSLAIEKLRSFCVNVGLIVAKESLRSSNFFVRLPVASNN